MFCSSSNYGKFLVVHLNTIQQLMNFSISLDIKAVPYFIMFSQTLHRDLMTQ
jgi:hypothetical protein